MKSEKWKMISDKWKMISEKWGVKSDPSVFWCFFFNNIKIVSAFFKFRPIAFFKVTQKTKVNAKRCFSQKRWENLGKCKTIFQGLIVLKQQNKHLKAVYYLSEINKALQ